MPTPRFSLIQIQGADAEKFLQGQVTCDLAQVTLTKGSYGAHCTPKGRVLFTFFLMRRDDNCFWMQLVTDQLEQSIKDLKKYAVFFKLQISDISQEFPSQLITTDTNTIPTSTPVLLDIQQTEQGIIRRRHTHYWELMGNPELAMNSSTQIFADNSRWALLDIQQGIAHVHTETRELFTPEDINYPLIEGVSFRKGCYTGQEIVARMHYKGKHKRHSHLFHFTSSEALKAGMTIHHKETDQKIGELVNIGSINHSQEWAALCSIQDDAKDMAVIGDNRQKMRWHSLPYAIPVAED
jgi:tRNA-modifying protein YgfZ